MCNQSVGLIQRAIEYAGITTVSISLLREITEKVQPPRALFVPYPLGHPLGEPDDVELQTRIIRSAFALLPRTDSPVLESFTP
jgi:D-proline reductase (dithiol) PrdB